MIKSDYNAKRDWRGVVALKRFGLSRLAFAKRDAAGAMQDGRNIDGFKGLPAMLLDRPEGFVGAVTEKLLAYALGHRLDSRAAHNNNRLR